MEATHSTICKFSSPDDDLYQRMEDNLINLLTWAAQNSSFTNNLEASVSKTRGDLESFEDDPPTYMSVVDATTSNPDQAIRVRSRSDMSNTNLSILGQTANLSTFGQTVDVDIDQDQTTQVSKIFRTLSPFRALRSSESNLTSVVDKLQIDWPLRKCIHVSVGLCNC
jgi:hypothetical protein